MTTEKIHKKIALAQRHLTNFIAVTYPGYELTKMHKIYSYILNKFADGEIPRLIVSMPPQHGKTESSSRRLPAYILGRNPDKKIAIASYSQTFARKIGRDVRRIMADEKYRYIFPDSRLAEPRDKGYTNSADEAEVVDAHGSLILAGRGAGLTGMPLDCLIIDDLYKNSEEANSPIVRESVIDWYKTVAETRLHNDSQQLIVFTRWHQDDIVGWLEKKGMVEDLVSPDQIGGFPNEKWLRINFPSLKIGSPTQFDPRENGEALWPKRHSRKRLEDKRLQDSEVFESLYQGNPRPLKGLLYAAGFETYDSVPEKIHDRIAYFDTADQGKDYLCGICACVDTSGDIYVTDVLYTQSPAEVTEKQSAKMIIETNTSLAWFESNSGGRSYARNVERIITTDYNRRSPVKWFSQTKNKEARILTNAATLTQRVKFPHDWHKRWPEFHSAMMSFKKVFRSNTHDDAPDTLTGLAEKSASGNVMRPSNVSARSLGL